MVSAVLAIVIATFVTVAAVNYIHYYFCLWAPGQPFRPLRTVKTEPYFWYVVYCLSFFLTCGAVLLMRTQPWAVVTVLAGLTALLISLLLLMAETISPGEDDVLLMARDQLWVAPLITVVSAAVAYEMLCLIGWF